MASRRATLRATKGGKSRPVFFGKRTKRALNALLAVTPRTEGDATPLFISERGPIAGAKLSTKGLGQLVRRLARAGGVKGVRASPHTFRHFYAIEFLRAGGNLFSLQQALGHTSLQMVKRYVAWSEADLEQQSKALSPDDRLKR